MRRDDDRHVDRRSAAAPTHLVGAARALEAARLSITGVDDATPSGDTRSALKSGHDRTVQRRRDRRRPVEPVAYRVRVEQTTGLCHPVSSPTNETIVRCRRLERLAVMSSALILRQASVVVSDEDSRSRSGALAERLSDGHRCEDDIRHGARSSRARRRRSRRSARCCISDGRAPTSATRVRAPARDSKMAVKLRSSPCSTT